MTEPRRLALVAPLAGDRVGRIPDVFERLGPLLAEDHEVLLCSSRPSRIGRALDMATTVHRHRREVDLLIVHLYSGRAFVVEDLVSRIGRRHQLPMVGVVSGGGFPDFQLRHPRWVPAVLERFRALVAPSPHLARWADAFGVSTQVIPNPLDVDEYSFRSRPHLEPRLFWMRAYHPIYRPLVALDVVDRLRERHPGVRLTMAGPDKGELDTVTREVEARGLGDVVELKGFVGPDEKRQLFDAHDVFLNTPAVDNRPVSLVEAAASGLAIVSTDAGGIPALVTDDHSAVLAPVDDADALAEGVLQLLTDTDRAQRIIRGAQEVAAEGRPERVLAEWNRLLGTITA